MPLDRSRIEAVVFDYGNTLIRFGEEQLCAYGESLFAALEAAYGPADKGRFFELRQQSRLEPYAGDPPEYRENDLPFITTRLVRELYQREPAPAELAALLQARFDSFVKVVEIAPEVKAMIERLATRYPLGLLSNYPDGPAIRASLEKIGLSAFFASIAVSGDIGFIKPHPITFATSLKDLGLTAPAILFVGDNWLADVQGAKRLGMQVVRSIQWIPPEHFDQQAEDLLPDAEINDILELEALLAE